VELKQMLEAQKAEDKSSFNRTIVELKLPALLCPALPYLPLIEPLWN